MRRILFIISVLFAYAAYANNTLTLSTDNGSPGELVTLSVALTNTDAIAAAEIVIPLGDYISYVPNSAALDPARANGHQVSAMQVDNELRLYVYSLSLTALNGSSGELLTCQLRLGNTAVTQSLIPQVVLSDATGAPLTSTSTPTSISILAPMLQVVNNQIDFGHIPIRSTYTQTLQLHNSGTTPLTINEIQFPASEFSCAQLPLTISAGATQSVTIRYAPVNRGAVEETAIVISDAINGLYNDVRNVSITADPFSVNELHVGSVSGVADDTVTIPLTMNNMEPIVAGEISFRLPQQLVPVANSFVLSSRANGHQTMTAIHGDTLTLYFLSMSNTPLTGDDGEIGTFRLALDGNSGYYDLNPICCSVVNAQSENMLSATTSGYVTIQSPGLYAATTLDMGDIAVTETGLAELTISNNGDAPLIIDRVAFLAEGYSCTTALPVTIPSWQSTILQVSHTPQDEGAFSTTMQVYTNDPSSRIHSVRLSGEAYEANMISLSGFLSGGQYVLSVSLDNYSAISAVQFDITGLPNSGVSIVPNARLAAHAAMILPLDATTYRVVAYSMSNAPIVGHQGEIMQIRFTPDAVVDCSITNIVLSNLAGVSKVSAGDPFWQDTPVITHRGDVNRDGIINVTDATIVLGHYIENTTSELSATIADVNEDGLINVTDVSEIINIYINNL